MSSRRLWFGGGSGTRRACLGLALLALTSALGCAKPVCVGKLPPRPVPSQEALIQEIETVPEGSPFSEYLVELDEYLDAIGAPL